MHTGLSRVSRTLMGGRMDTVCGDIQRAARKHMEDLVWTRENREGGGDIIDLPIRACFTQYCAGDKIEKNEMGGLCGTYGGRESCAQDFGGET